jgi:hypothetical protein
MHAPQSSPDLNSPMTIQVTTACTQFRGRLSGMIVDPARTRLVRGPLLGILLAALLAITGCGSPSTPVPQSPPPPPPPPPPSATVVITPATATVLRGKTQLFTATVSGQSDQTDMESGCQYREHRQHGIVHRPFRFRRQRRCLRQRNKQSYSKRVRNRPGETPNHSLFDHTWRRCHRPRGESNLQCKSRRA